MNTAVPYYIIPQKCGVDKCTLRRQMTASQMACLKSLTERRIQERYGVIAVPQKGIRIRQGLWMRFGIESDHAIYWDISMKKFRGDKNNSFAGRPITRKMFSVMDDWCLHEYDPAYQFKLQSVILRAEVELDTDMDLSWYLDLICKSVWDVNYKVLECTTDRCVIGCNAHVLTLRLKRYKYGQKLIFKAEESRRAVKDYMFANKTKNSYDALNQYDSYTVELISNIWRIVLKNDGCYLNKEGLRQKLRSDYRCDEKLLMEISTIFSESVNQAEAEGKALAKLMENGRTREEAKRRLKDCRETFTQKGVSMIYLLAGAPVVQMPSVLMLLQAGTYESLMETEQRESTLMARFSCDNCVVDCDQCEEWWDCSSRLELGAEEA